ncbi:hypothetical protein ACIQZB_35230 [Streptomyces sp. NPDC097727]|uniref:hypothetical protein n=1 Tax=Streptomyces sp. NPDC097727 TaxID=3366092 RepID=UPI00382AF0F4
MIHHLTMVPAPLDTFGLPDLTCAVLDSAHVRAKNHTFREQVSGVLERHQRRTARLTRQVKPDVKELAGWAGHVCR